MIRNHSFWIRLFVVGAVFLFMAGRAHGQTAPAISFDALPRAQKTAAPAPAPGRDKVLRDSIARLNRTLDSVRNAGRGTRYADTVTVTRVDTVRVPVPPPAPTALKAAASAPAAITFAPTSVSGLLQIQFSGGDAANYKSTYRVRRAEVKVVSDLGRKTQATVMIDISKALSLSTSGTTTTVSQGSRALQDAYLTLPVRRVTLDAGQQRLPIGLEGAHGSSALEMIDRALFQSDRARGASFGDVRDLGVTARGSWRALDYRAGVYNGSGETMNEADKNVGKALAGQLIWKPKAVKGFRFGASGATSGRATSDKPIRDRVGADLQLNRGKVLVQTEAMVGRDAAIVRQGMYALGAYSVRPSFKLTTRFDAWDPNIKAESTAADITERDYLAGFTWFPPATRLKVQLAVVRKTYTHSITPAATLALTQIQAAW